MNLEPTPFEALDTGDRAVKRLVHIADDYLSHNTMSGDAAAYADVINIAFILQKALAEVDEYRAIVNQLSQIMSTNV